MPPNNPFGGNPSNLPQSHVAAQQFNYNNESFQPGGIPSDLQQSHVAAQQFNCNNESFQNVHHPNLYMPTQPHPNQSTQHSLFPPGFVASPQARPATVVRPGLAYEESLLREIDEFDFDSEVRFSKYLFASPLSWHSFYLDSFLKQSRKSQ
jgi:hypothetical protein